MSKNRDLRGTNNTNANTAYSETVANYDSNVSADGDNIVEGLTCDSSVFVGAIVRLNSTTVVNAQANNVANSEIIGICIEKPTSTSCNVLTCGFTGTIFSGLTAGENYFLSPSSAGQITTSVPTGSGQVVLQIGVALNTQQVVYRPSIRLVRA